MSETGAAQSEKKKSATLRKAGRGRPVGDRSAKRKELLAAGIAVIAEQGYSGASLRKVAQKAGYTTGAVTYYFENKEALVAAIIEHLFDQWDTILEVGEGGYDIRARYLKWLSINAGSDIWSAQFQLLAQARHEPVFAEIYERRYARYRHELAGILERQQASGQIRDDIAADLLADNIGAIGDAWMMMLPLEPKRFTPERIEALIGSVITMLSPR